MRFSSKSRMIGGGGAGTNAMYSRRPGHSIGSKIRGMAASGAVKQAVYAASEPIQRVIRQHKKGNYKGQIVKDIINSYGGMEKMTDQQKAIPKRYDTPQNVQAREAMVYRNNTKLGLGGVEMALMNIPEERRQTDIKEQRLLVKRAELQQRLSNAGGSRQANFSGNRGHRNQVPPQQEDYDDSNYYAHAI